MENNNILEAIQLQLQKYQTEFDQIEVEITQQTEALQNLRVKREQLRGAYTSLYNIYNGYTQTTQTSEVPEKKEVKEEVKEETLTKNLKENKKDDKNDNTLTLEEVAKLQEKLNKPKKSASTKQPKNEDIPDYLKSEYNK